MNLLSNHHINILQIHIILIQICNLNLFDRNHEVFVTFFYKNRGTSIWEQPCSVVTLTENARIFKLDGQESLTHLNEKYAWSYDLLSKDYDGMFVHVLGLIGDVSDAKLREQILRFGVDSLILFNLSCIDYYQSGIVAIEPFDYEYGDLEMTSYEIKYDNTKRRVRLK